MSNPTSGLRLGLVLPPCPTPHELRASASYIDDSGIHSLWVTDRTVAGMPWLDALTALGTLAAVTRRVRIGTSVLVLPRRNPVHVAHALATVDHLSEGRLIVGVGVGNSAVSAAEFDIAGVDMARRGRVTDEYLDLLRRLWTSDDVDHEGEGWRWAGVSLAPKPVRWVPVWVGGSTSAARRRAGRAGDGWLAVFSSPERFPAEWTEVQEEARSHGRDGASLVPAAYLFGAIDEDGTTSRHTLDATLRGFLGAPLEAVADTCIWGTPEQWLDRLAAWEAAGVRHVNVALFTDRLEYDTRLIGEHIVPHLSHAPADIA
ncbi:LLM class flavin-dependent oxidoreductase [Streptomyces mirabilis]|uniref:LLM class flavin-dependent oxidoreductase n=1 Tax=Streptomyces mirabilis TaxID=68239 RepID=UPI0036A24B3E